VFSDVSSGTIGSRITGESCDVQSDSEKVFLAFISCAVRTISMCNMHRHIGNVQGIRSVFYGWRVIAFQNEGSCPLEWQPGPLK